jgi:hypothetical protein
MAFLKDIAGSSMTPEELKTAVEAVSLFFCFFSRVRGIAKQQYC